MLSRKTEWIEASAGTFLGRGQRMLTTDAGEYAVMDIRRIDLDSETESEEGGPARDSSDA